MEQYKAGTSDDNLEEYSLNREWSLARSAPSGKSADLWMPGCSDGTLEAPCIHRATRRPLTPRPLLHERGKGNCKRHRGAGTSREAATARSSARISATSTALHTAAFSAVSVLASALDGTGSVSTTKAPGEWKSRTAPAGVPILCLEGEGVQRPTCGCCHASPFNSWPPRLARCPAQNRDRAVVESTAVPEAAGD